MKHTGSIKNKYRNQSIILFHFESLKNPKLLYEL